ncbi:MAG: tRNA (N(6)-L-threonylcarbamoyladenosine(37)-C(2))-methylthiotransferase MtaB [Terriglobia bacterium]|jgi:threonylcarbamoyladenosine tRNA methylthiotransferase MtaB
MTTFQILNFGCRASQADGAAIKKQLLEAGLHEAEDGAASEVAILNTCTVTARADAEVRQVVRRIHRANPRCRILVTGCYAQRSPAEVAQLGGVTWVVGNSHKHVIADLISSNLSQETGVGTQESGVRSQESESAGQTDLVQIRQIETVSAISNQREVCVPAPAAQAGSLQQPLVLVGEISEEFHFAPVFPDDRTRPTLKVQDGCNARCSFCVIPSVRGRSRSLAPQKVIEQVRELESSGYKEIVLSGINLGSYGRDLDRRITFLSLLERLLGETAIDRLRISSIEPMDVTPALIKLAAHEPRLAQHFHIPLQSGCSRILRLMNRRYWPSQYAERILAIRDQIPNAGIGADVMVGFPGETDQDHAASAAFIESLPFTYLHIFPYSARPQTPAAASPQQVNGRVAHERAQEIRTLLAPKRQTFLRAQVGRKLSALTLDESQGGERVALSSNYLKIVLPGSNPPPNTLTDFQIGRVHQGLLFGFAD